MTIDFKCECCKKIVKAPEDAGGKWGKCPHCKHRCYIPTPPSEDDEKLELVPIDENELTRYNEMMKETHNLTKSILHETTAPESQDDEPDGPNEKELIKTIIIYLLNMSKGNLESAEKMVAELNRFSIETKDILTRMAKTERPEPELRQIPDKLLNGLMKNLYTQLT